MISLDTNVLVRCLTLDDPVQVPAAKALLVHGEGVFVAKTVLLELEWVLRAAYKLSRPAIHAAMGKLLGLPNLTIESPSQVSLALDAFSRGLDFADALHLFSSADDEGLFTFDDAFVSLATAAGHNVYAAGSGSRAGP